MTLTFVLIHSPLTGPEPWSRVAGSLRHQGIATVVPALDDNGDVPFWPQHVENVSRQRAGLLVDRPVLLVGHSGAGPLLPAISRALPHRVAGYVFIDAGIPEDGKSRLDLMATEDPDFAAWLRSHLAAGGMFPAWTDTDLAEAIPDPVERRAILAGLRPRPMDFFAEPIPVFAGWPDAPCGYVQLSAAYDRPAAYARESGWEMVTLDAGHFHMAVEPDRVAALLIAMAERLIAPNSVRTR